MAEEEPSYWQGELAAIRILDGQWGPYTRCPQCDRSLKILTSGPNSKNPGRNFVSCRKNGGYAGCEKPYFSWVLQKHVDERQKTQEANRRSTAQRVQGEAVCGKASKVETALTMEIEQLKSDMREVMGRLELLEGGTE